MNSEMMPWILFNLGVFAMLALDLGVFHRKAHRVSMKEALIWSAVWVTLAALFGIGVYFFKGHDASLQFFTGYVIEKTLSVDNIFIFLLIFSAFAVKDENQHKVLFWGIIGALIFRAIFIAVGITLIERFHWMIYVFGIVLLVTGVKLAFEKEKEIHAEKNIALRLLKRVMPITDKYDGGKFFVKKDKKTWATPLFVVLLVIETTDIIFAVDSIPAVLAISSDPFIVYTSNVFAILGLRSLYFALCGIMQLFHHLHYGLAAILGFVGIKMLISDFYHVPIALSLGFIAITIILSVAASLMWPKPVIIEEIKKADTCK